jgi:hypothetical protein
VAVRHENSDNRIWIHAGPTVDTAFITFVTKTKDKKAPVIALLGTAANDIGADDEVRRIRGTLMHDLLEPKLRKRRHFSPLSTKSFTDNGALFENFLFLTSTTQMIMTAVAARHRGTRAYKTSAFVVMASLAIALDVIWVLPVSNDRVQSDRRVAESSELSSIQLWRVRLVISIVK